MIACSATQHVKIALEKKIIARLAMEACIISRDIASQIAQLFIHTTMVA